MTDRIAHPHPTIPHGFHIPVNPDRLANFPHQSPIAVVLNDRLSGYTVYGKDIPDGLAQKTHKNKKVHWINNFGLKEKGQSEFAGSLPDEYTILLEKIEHSEYVYFDGSQIRPLPVTPHPQDDTRVSAVLRLGDPPIGWVR
jgi:hypothetical protein